MGKRALDSNYVSRAAGADLTGKAGTAVKLDANNAVVAATSTSDDVFGILATEGVSGEQVSIRIRNANGTGLVVAGGNIALYERLTVDSNGKAVAATSGQKYFGRALETAVANDRFEYTSELGIV